MEPVCLPLWGVQGGLYGLYGAVGRGWCPDPYPCASIPCGARVGAVRGLKGLGHHEGGSICGVETF